MSQQDILFVGNLSYFCTESDLSALFSSIGTVKLASIPRSRNGTTLYYGFIRMASSVDNQLAITKLSGTKFMGRNLKVCISKQSNKAGGARDRADSVSQASTEKGATTPPGAVDTAPAVEPTTEEHEAPVATYQVHVSFLGAHVDRFLVSEIFLDHVFSGFGRIYDTVIKQHQISSVPHPRQYGYGYVHFFDLESAQAATETFCGSETSDVDGVRLDCKLSKECQERLQKSGPMSRSMVGHRSTSSHSTDVTRSGSPADGWHGPTLVTADHDPGRGTPQMWRQNSPASFSSVTHPTHHSFAGMQKAGDLSQPSMQPQQQAPQQASCFPRPYIVIPSHPYPPTPPNHHSPTYYASSSNQMYRASAVPMQIPMQMHQQPQQQPQQPQQQPQQQQPPQYQHVSVQPPQPQAPTGPPQLAPLTMNMPVQYVMQSAGGSPAHHLSQSLPPHMALVGAHHSHAGSPTAYGANQMNQMNQVMMMMPAQGTSSPHSAASPHAAVMPRMSPSMHGIAGPYHPSMQYVQQPSGGSSPSAAMMHPSAAYSIATHPHAMPHPGMQMAHPVDMSGVQAMQGGHPGMGTSPVNQHNSPRY